VFAPPATSGDAECITSCALDEGHRLSRLPDLAGDRRYARPRL